MGEVNLGALLGLLLPSPLAPILEALNPSPQRPPGPLPAQETIAGYQVGGRLRAGLSGLAGSEAEYAEAQATPDVLYQPLTSARRPVAMFRALEPPEYETGPHRRGEPWGADHRAKAPKVTPGTLNPPGDRSPTAREMQTAYAAGHAADRRLFDLFTED